MNHIPSFCTECRSEIEEDSQVIFVEDSKKLSFCSEECVMSFFRPHMEFFLELESTFKERLGLEELQDFSKLYSDESVLDSVIDHPDDTFQNRDALGNTYHLHVKYLADSKLYFLVVCSYCEGKVAFIFNKIVTQKLKLVNSYKEFFKGKFEVESDLEEKEVEIPEEVLGELELKKSQELALLLERRSENDVPFENFFNYDEYLPTTLENPDSLFEYKDDNDDDIANYIKSFKEGDQEFYYVVSCFKVDIQDGQVTKTAILPIISFPSNDRRLYQFYAVGADQNGGLKS